MNRLQKKCLVASVGTHLLLVVILFVGPALSSRGKLDDLPVLDFVPAKLIDAPFYGGGTPNAKPPPPAPPAPPAPAPPPPPALQTPPAPPKAAVKTPAVAPNLEKTVVKQPGEDVEPAPKPKVQVSTKLVKRSGSSATTGSSGKSPAETRAAQQAAANQRADAVGGVIRSLRENLSSGTTVEIPPGPGGAAYANYAQAVKSVYTQAWIAPDDVTDDEATAKVSVTIARDGTVISARITIFSGSTPVDRSVQQTLNRVNFVAPFPEGAKEAERTFIINFNLKTKRLLG